MKPTAALRVSPAMESRGLILIATTILLVACFVLSRGWMETTEDAIAERDACRRERVRRVGDIPRIVVGAQSIVYRGEFVAPLDVVMHRFSPEKIEVLYEKLTRDLAQTCDATSVCLDNLVVLEMQAIDNHLINLISATAWAAGYDLIVARPRSARAW